MIVHLQYQMIK